MKSFGTYLSLFLLLPIGAWAQSIPIQFVYGSENESHSVCVEPAHVPDTAALKETLNVWLDCVRSKGYLGASLDTVWVQPEGITVKVFVGGKTEFATIANGNVPETYWIKNGQKRKKSIVKSFEEITQEQNDILYNYSRKGYPFASISLDSIKLEQGTFSASRFVQPNDYIEFDSIIINGQNRLKQKWLQGYLDVRATEMYDQKHVENAYQRLQQLSFVDQKQSPDVFFVDSKAHLNVYLERNKANRFNFILGFLPNNQLDNRKLTITGDGELFLVNSFGVGEEIEASFKQIKPRTQDLNLRFLLPNIPTLPIGLQTKVDFFKNDTSFFELEANVGLIHRFNGVNSFEAYYQKLVSNILNYDTLQIVATKKLPELIDVTSNNYGMGVKFQALDYVLNPRKGFQFSIGASVGNRKIRENSNLLRLVALDGDTLNNLYSGVRLNQIQYHPKVTLDYFIPIRKRSTLLFSSKFEALITKDIFDNEKFRIGGFKLLRGFDEQNFLSPFYAVNTIEYRFLLSKNSYFHTFFDLGTIELDENNVSSIVFPFGFGTGVSLETKSGIFALSYALGKGHDTPLQFRNGKIHFGYINLF